MISKIELSATQPERQNGNVDVLNRDALVAFYTSKDPEKVGNVDKMLEKFDIPELREALQKKYGDAPTLLEEIGQVEYVSGVTGSVETLDATPPVSMVMSDASGTAEPPVKSSKCCCFDCDDVGDDDVRGTLVIHEGALGVNVYKFGVGKHGWDEEGKPYHVAFDCLTIPTVDGAGSKRVLIGSLEKGMVLYQVNGADMRGVPFGNASELIQKTRPVQLVFVPEAFVRENATSILSTNLGSGVV
jgi:hypothetical protein